MRRCKFITLICGAAALMGSAALARVQPFPLNFEVEHIATNGATIYIELMNTGEANPRRVARDERYREDTRAEWEMNYGRIIGEL